MRAHDQSEPMPARVLVTGGFDDLRSRDVRFLQEASRLGAVTALVWSDDKIRAATGKQPKFPEAERLYLVRSLRYVAHAKIHSAPTSFLFEEKPEIYALPDLDENPDAKTFCERNGVHYHIIPVAQLAGFPNPSDTPAPQVSARKKVLVTGCYDWLHSGHVRFFEEVSGYGDVYAVVGHDANIRLLKGEGHPLLSQEERRYLVGSVRYVTQAWISTGHGWLDAEPEIERLKPDIYAVNEDGDRGGKRDFCSRHGIQYLVLKRVPAPGLPPRTSTNLRGF